MKKLGENLFPSFFRDTQAKALIAYYLDKKTSTEFGFVTRKEFLKRAKEAGYSVSLVSYISKPPKYWLYTPKGYFKISKARYEYARKIGMKFIPMREILPGTIVEKSEEMNFVTYLQKGRELMKDIHPVLAEKLSTLAFDTGKGQPYEKKFLILEDLFKRFQAVSDLISKQ